MGDATEVTAVAPDNVRRQVNGGMPGMNEEVSG